MKKKVGQIGVMERAKLAQLVSTVLTVRDSLVDKYPEDGARTVEVQTMARMILRQLGRDRISWDGLNSREAGIMRQLVQEVDGVPDFVARIVDQLLEDVEKRGQRKEGTGDRWNFGTQTEEGDMSDS